MDARIRHGIALACLVCAACAAQQKPAEGAGEFAPQMFGAEQLREAFPKGTELRFRFEAEGAPTVIEHWTWVESDATSATIKSEKLDEHGKALAAPEKGTSSWEELAKHGLFPRQHTIVENASLETSLGNHECRLYKVEGTDEKGEPVIKTFYFAIDLPGPPIRFETWKQGRRIFHAEMIERSNGAKAH